MSGDVTKWFPGDVKPVRPGVYEREYNCAGGSYAEWTGCQWLVPSWSPRAASKNFTVAFTQDGLRWRGLAKDPKS